MNSETQEKSKKFAFAEEELTKRIERTKRARSTLEFAKDAEVAAGVFYMDLLGKEINARLQESGKAFCRWERHVVEGATRILYVTGETERNSHEWGTSRRSFREILPICNLCQSKVTHFEAQEREDGWYYLKDGEWRAAGDPGLNFLLMPYPEDRQLEELASEFGLKAPSYFAALRKH